MAWQASQQAGNGAITTIELTTVANPWWGIEAGFRCNVTWAYLSRCFAWENDLPGDLKELVIPNTGNVSDPSNLRSSGPFQSFPHYEDVSQVQLTNEQANLLSDLGGWFVNQNLGLLKAALGGGDGCTGVCVGRA